MTDAEYLRARARNVTQTAKDSWVNQPNDTRDLLDLMSSIEITLINYRNNINQLEAIIQNQAEQIALLKRQRIRQIELSPTERDLPTQSTSELSLPMDADKCDGPEKAAESSENTYPPKSFQFNLDKLSERVTRFFGSYSADARQTMKPSLGEQVTGSTASFVANADSPKPEANPDDSGSLQRVSVSSDTATFRFWFWPSESAASKSQADGSTDQE